MPTAVNIHTNNPDASLKALIAFFCQEKLEALNEITNARAISPPVSFGEPLFSGDLESDSIVKFLKASPVLNVGFSNGQLKSSWQVNEILCKYMEIPEAYKNRETIDKAIIKIQASCDSYRRFNCFIRDANYSLRTFSKGHMPKRCIDTISDGKSMLPSMEPAVPEREIVRSFILHEALYSKGVKFFSEPAALIEFMSPNDENFYLGTLKVDAYTPIDLAVNKKFANGMRLTSMTPDLMEGLAKKKEMDPKEYMNGILNNIGGFLKKLNYFEDDILLLSCTAVSKFFYSHLFGEDFGSNTFAGEFNLHNIDVDLETGEIALADDFSHVFPITTRKDELYIQSNITPYKVKVFNVTEDEMDKARKAPVAFFLNSTIFDRPFVKCMYAAGLLNRNEYREHTELVEELADIEINASHHEKITQDVRAIIPKIKELLYNVFPYYKIEKHNCGEFNVYLPAEARHDHFKDEFTLIAQLDKKERDVFFDKIRLDFTSEYGELLANIKCFHIEHSNYSGGALIRRWRDINERLAKGKVAQILYEGLMKGHNK